MSDLLATYVHHLDPIIFQIGFFKLRWYGMAYLGGFAAGYFLLKNLAKRGLWVMKPEEAGDFIAAAALLGVFLGGRLGYVIFYELLDTAAKRADLLAKPWSVFYVTDGGMASHGGIIGLLIFTWFYARRKKVAWTALGDGLCVVAPIGLFFGRLANFVNGELYGRVDSTISWAMKFPMALNDRKAPEFQHFESAYNAVAEAVPSLATSQEDAFNSLLEANRKIPEVRTILDPYLEPRHPSQLYEAFLEGVVLFSILWFVRVKFPKAPNGLLTGLFFFLYAVFRIVSEQFREPDAAMFGPVTKGQFLSFFMFAFAAAFFLHAWRGWKRDGLNHPA